MKRKALTMLLALTLVFSIVGVSLADFDFSLFENHEQYDFDVVFDRMDDTGVVNFPKELDPFPTAYNSIVTMDIRTLGENSTVLRLYFTVLDSWINADKIILLPDETRYTIDALSDTDYYLETMKKETIITLVVPKLMPMFEEIIEKEITSVTYRLDGDKDIDGNITVNVDNLKTIMDLFKAAGGLEQNYTLYETMFPVTVK